MVVYYLLIWPCNQAMIFLNEIPLFHFRNSNRYNDRPCGFSGAMGQKILRGGAPKIIWDDIVGWLRNPFQGPKGNIYIYIDISTCTHYTTLANRVINIGRTTFSLTDATPGFQPSTVALVGMSWTHSHPRRLTGLKP